MSRSKVNSQGILATERRVKALALRKQDKTYQEIATEIGMSVSGVRRAVGEEFKRLKAEKNGLAEEAFQINLDRLNQLLEAVWDQAMEGEVKPVMAALSIIDRQNRMMGLEVPAKRETKVTFGNLSEAELIVEARRLGIPVME